MTISTIFLVANGRHKTLGSGRLPAFDSRISVARDHAAAQGAKGWIVHMVGDYFGEWVRIEWESVYMQNGEGLEDAVKLFLAYHDAAKREVS